MSRSLFRNRLALCRGISHLAGYMKAFLRLLLSVLLCLYIILCLPIAVLAMMLIVQGETVQGRMFGWVAVLLMVVPVLIWLTSYAKRRRQLVVVSLCLVATGAILIGVCYYMTPDGRALPGACAESLFAGDTAYSRASIANLVPEIDQLKLGAYVFGKIDPYMDSARAVRVRRLFLAVYRDMQSSDEFTRLGSVLNYAYLDLFLGGRPAGHFYQYIPKTKGNDERLPVILFLHGSLGNFKGYLWVWKRFADENGYAIVAPTYGAGNWYERGGTAAIENARRSCLAHPRMDGNRIYLAGLSNGGTGVTRAAAANGEAYAGFIFISPVIEPEIISSEQFVAGCKGRRILVIHGSADERIPVKYIEQPVSLMTGRGLDVKASYFPDEDHFLLFSKPDQVRANVAAWLK